MAELTMSLREIYAYRIYLSSVKRDVIDKTVNILKKLIGENNIINVNVRESEVVDGFYLIEIYSTAKVNSSTISKEIGRIGLNDYNFKVDIALVKKP